MNKNDNKRSIKKSDVNNIYIIIYNIQEQTF